MPRSTKGAYTEIKAQGDARDTSTFGAYRENRHKGAKVYCSLMPCFTLIMSQKVIEVGVDILSLT